MQGTNGRGERQGKFSGSVAASSTKKEGAAVQTGSCRAQEGFDDRKKGAASRRRGRLDRCLPSLLGQAEPGSNGGACETLTRNQAALRGGRGQGCGERICGSAEWEGCRVGSTLAPRLLQAPAWSGFGRRRGLGRPGFDADAS